MTNTGHAHPRVAAAIAAQAAKLLHGQQNILYHEPGLRLYDRLRTVLPGGPWQAFLSNSGAEAVEASVKLARVATGRPAILAFRYGYHGRTAQTMALTTAKDVYRGAFEPLPGLRLPHGLSVLLSSRRRRPRPRRLHLRLGGPARPDVPPVHLPGPGRRRSSSSRSSARAATSSRRRASCRGCARSPASTGSCSSPTRSRPASGGPARCSRSQHWDVEPDILVMAKGIASGLPLSGILARRELMAPWKPGTHGGTYGGNVVSCAAANATLDVIEDEGLVANARERGDQFLGRPARAGRRSTRRSATSRGLGLMVAIELVKPGVGDGRVPDPDLTKRIQAEALARKLIVLTAGTYVNVVRIIPPLVTTAAEVDQALAILDESLAAAGA